MAKTPKNTAPVLNTNAIKIAKRIFPSKRPEMQERTSMAPTAISAPEKGYDKKFKVRNSSFPLAPTEFND